MNEQELIHDLNDTMDLAIPAGIDMQELHWQLAAYANELIEKDFQKLVNLLYRMDVSETKLRDFLATNSREDAGALIAVLIIERELQKIKSRQQFSKRDDSIDESEKW
ncbi:MAG: hypothetical protein ABIR18_07430 [Chitinophagaceae bacterium]